MRISDRITPLSEVLSRPIASAISAAALRHMGRATSLIYLDGEQCNRANRMAWAKERWICGHPDREVLVTRCGAVQDFGHWVAIFLEGDKGIVSARGMTEEEALAQGFALLAAANRS